MEKERPTYNGKPTTFQLGDGFRQAGVVGKIFYGLSIASSIAGMFGGLPPIPFIVIGMEIFRWDRAQRNAEAEKMDIRARQNSERTSALSQEIARAQEVNTPEVMQQASTKFRTSVTERRQNAAEIQR